MSDTEKFYTQGIAKMSPADKVARGIELFCLAHRAIANQLLKEFPDLTKEELNLLVAERMYVARKDTVQILGTIREQQNNAIRD